ncbi:hypothetical protein MAM1_0603d10997 [Mucor ambiguus]|uniref:Uncharacterized protein n=1 Tax=Mucor ambiguus TaxID=91626 RepID=A0A0C9MVK5_9FUNG|nr:hypothetical protein MAM1_0603d10997 [Mucor ambiguus]
MSLNIATNGSFEDDEEGGAVDNKANDNGTANNTVEAKVINGHAEQEATDDVVFPPTAKYSENLTHLRPDFWR